MFSFGVIHILRRQKGGRGMTQRPRHDGSMGTIEPPVLRNEHFRTPTFLHPKNCQWLMYKWWKKQTVFHGLFQMGVAESKSLSFQVYFGTDQTFEMRCIRSLTSQWSQKYQPAKLNNRLFKFDGWYFQNHWEFSDLMYLILKV